MSLVEKPKLTAMGELDTANVALAVCAIQR